MGKVTLDRDFWTRSFAVTSGDLDRVHASLKRMGKPQTVMTLLAEVVQHKLEASSLDISAEQRTASLAAAHRLLEQENVQVYRQSGDYGVGQRLLVAWTDASGKWHYGAGKVVQRRPASEPHYRWVLTLQFPDGSNRSYIAGADLRHPNARHWTLFSVAAEIETSPHAMVDEVLRLYGSDLLPHLLGRLDADDRFVLWAGYCWLSEALPALPHHALDRAARFLWKQGQPVTLDKLLTHLRQPTDEPHRWALNAALARDPRFAPSGPEMWPAWAAPLPENLLRTAEGELLDLEMPARKLWIQIRELLHQPPPKEWLDNPNVLHFGGRWLPKKLLMPLEEKHLRQVQQFLSQSTGGVSDVDILREVFGITTDDDDYDRWRFTLSYLLHQRADELGVEFVGSGQRWSWASRSATPLKPERHRRRRGTERLEIPPAGSSRPLSEQGRDEAVLEMPSGKVDPEWKPTAETWEYVLTYYDWDHGILPYNHETRTIIPPLAAGQQRAELRFVAEQMDGGPFPVHLCTDGRTAWLQSEQLKEFFVTHLVPGARVYVDRTETMLLYKIRYRQTRPLPRRVLFFTDGRTRPEIREVEISCEVDEDMLLAEGRFTNVEALSRLDLINRRTAPKVLARVFELVGEKDLTRGTYHANVTHTLIAGCGPRGGRRNDAGD